MAKNTNKTDLRIQRTQKAIIDAFYELLDEKSFGSITVIDICDRALINRGTFYTHFEDKYQLLDKCISDVMYGLHEQVKQAHGENDLITYYNEVMALGINYLAQHRRRLRTIILKADSALVFDKVHEILTHNIVNRLSKAKPKAGMGKVPADILAEFFAGGIISLIKWWLLEEPNYTEDQTATQHSCGDHALRILRLTASFSDLLCQSPVLSRGFVVFRHALSSCSSEGYLEFPLLPFGLSSPVSERASLLLKCGTTFSSLEKSLCLALT